MEQDEITIVSGLPRSGTSMMMKMLEAVGLPILTDNLRAADADNPKGYFEFERVKKLATDTAWVPEARGKVVKVISGLLKHLPPSDRYRVIFMRRDMTEVLASQAQMLVRRGQPAGADDAKMAGLFGKHLAEVEAWLATQPNIAVLYVSYNAMLADPATEVPRVNRFLGGHLDETTMRGVVDQALHRQRH